MNNYSCYLISNKPEFFEPISKSLSPEKLHYFNGANYSSFSKLVNDCVCDSNTETVIIMSDKVLPTAENVKKALELIDKGYAFVALFRFAFFAFNKELFRRIGPLDERFVGGGHEDDDFYIRLYEANLSMYITQEIFYEKKPSSWNYSKSRQHFYNKWGESLDPIERKIPEEKYNYDFGPSTNQDFLSWEHSYIVPTKAKRWFMRPMVLNNKIVPGPIKPKGVL
jgi:hypothetical protein